MDSYKGNVAEEWKPTLENVTREFITGSLHEIFFSENLPNFVFEFREDEAIEFIEKTLEEYSEKYVFEKEKTQKVLEKLKQKNDGNIETPVMVVKDYKIFFELLRQLYEKQIELYFLRTKRSGFVRYEKDNFFEQIWLRATPDDFNDPELFLKKQVEMVKDDTFEKYNKETYLGKLDYFNNNIFCVKNKIARTWDENSREFEIKIYDKNYYYDSEGVYKPSYILPVIRYGIYEKDGKKICNIGSIQDKTDNYSLNDFEKEINRKRYKVNQGVNKEDTYMVEPKKLIALGIFINLLNMEGITEIEIPSIYVLDYEYHVKRAKKLQEDFKKEWNEDKRRKYPEQYKMVYFYLQKSLNKEDLISEIKTERLHLTMRRLLNHYYKGTIESYPGENDSFMRLSIPVINSKEDIKGSIFRELYNLNKKMDNEIEK